MASGSAGTSADWSIGEVSTSAGGIETKFTAGVIETVETAIQAVLIELEVSLAGGLIWVFKSITTLFGETLVVGPALGKVLRILGGVRGVETELAAGAIQTVGSSVDAVGFEL